MNYQLKMTGEKYAEMRSALYRGAPSEGACFLLCNVSHGMERVTLLVREVISLDAIDYDIQKIDQVSVSPACMLSIARQAQRENCSVVMVHTHPNSNGSVAFSLADDIGNRSTFEFFNRFLSSGLHGCLVFDKSIKAVSGRIYHSSDDWSSISNVIAFGQGVHGYLTTFVEESAGATVDHSRFSRQTLLLGSEGQARLSKLHVVIVSAGGIGSLAAALVAHSSNAEITVIDPKNVSESNLSRLIGATQESVDFSKVNAVAKYVQSINPRCKVNALNMDVTEPDTLDYLKSADVIICGTDTALSRVVINEVSHRHSIPVLEMGVEFCAVSETGRIVSETGRINFMEPGTACFECCDLIDRQKLAFESCDPSERQRLVSDGYVRGAALPEPSMMMFNMEVVARGIQKMVGYFTGLIPNDPECYESFGFTGSNSDKHHRRVAKHRSSECIYCGEHTLGLAGAGDQTAFDQIRLADAF